MGHYGENDSTATFAAAGSAEGATAEDISDRSSVKASSFDRPRATTADATPKGTVKKPPTTKTTPQAIGKKPAAKQSTMGIGPPASAARVKELEEQLANEKESRARTISLLEQKIKDAELVALLERELRLRDEDEARKLRRETDDMRKRDAEQRNHCVVS
ncbi:MAG: hypothetical protein Q9208_001462 [Pyrenodesmia sp. 3 TL-2023]